MSKKKILIIIIAIFMLSAGGYYYLNSIQATSEEKTPVTRVLTIEKQDLSEVLSTTGVVQSANIKNVLSKIAGEVELVHFEIGDEVREGDILANIDSTNIKASIQDLKSKQSNTVSQLNNLKTEGNVSLINSLNNAQTVYDNATLSYENNKQLFNVGSISKNELDGSIDSKNRAHDDLELAKIRVESFNIKEEIALLEEDIAVLNTNIEILETDLLDTIIASPIDGVLTIVNIEEGNWAQQNSLLFVVKDLSALEVEVFISEYDISKIELNQKVTITPLGNREMEYTGLVTKIYPNAEIAGGESTVKVLVTIENEDEKLLANFNVVLEIMINKVENALVIPYEALVSLRDGKHGIMIKENDDMKMIPVETGVRGDLHIQIISDEISEGMEIHVRSIIEGANENGDRPGFMPNGGGRNRP
ncbi:MAG: efflux RND transporter periplasmic adaptor subunit [Alkaliphilus sp.]